MIGSAACRKSEREKGAIKDHTYALKRMAFEMTAPKKLERIRLAWGPTVTNLSGMMGFAARDSISRKTGKAIVNSIKAATTSG